MKVRFYANLRAALGCKTLDLPFEEGGTVEQLVDLVVELHPELSRLLLDEDAKLSARVNLFVDGRSAIHLPDGLATRLSPEREIDIFPAVAGG